MTLVERNLSRVCNVGPDLSVCLTVCDPFVLIVMVLVVIAVCPWFRIAYPRSVVAVCVLIHSWSCTIVYVVVVCCKIKHIQTTSLCPSPLLTGVVGYLGKDVCESGIVRAKVSGNQNVHTSELY